MTCFHQYLIKCSRALLLLCALSLLATSSVEVKAQQADSLQTYILAALRDNPEVAARWHAYEAALEAVCPAGTLGDPELSINFYPRPMTQVNGRQIGSVSLMQMFPWFGSLGAAKREKAWQAEAAWQRYREGGIALAYDVEQLWYKMLVTREKLLTTQRHHQLFTDIVQLQRFRYASGGGMKSTKMSDQYRLQAEQLKLEEQQESLRSLLATQQSQFNLLLHRDPSSPVVLPDSIALPEMPSWEWTEIEQSHPTLLSLKAQAEQYEAQGEKARKMGMPMVGVGVQYMLNSKRHDDMIMDDMNGMDMWMGMLKLTLPIYRHRIKAQRRSAELLRESATESYQRQADALRSQLLAVSQQLDDVKRKMALYQQDCQLLQTVLEFMKDEYRAGTTTLTDLLQTEREQLNYAFLLAEARAQWGMAVADFERIASEKVKNEI